MNAADSRKLPGLATAFFCAGMVLALLGFFAPDTRSRGWFWVCGFALLAVPSICALYPDASPRAPAPIWTRVIRIVVLVLIVLFIPFALFIARR
jgi:hypothetical protein